MAELVTTPWGTGRIVGTYEGGRLVEVAYSTPTATPIPPHREEPEMTAETTVEATEPVAVPLAVRKRAAAKKAAVRKPVLHEAVEVREPDLTDELDDTAKLELAVAEIESLRATIATLRTDIRFIGEGLAVEAANHGSSYCTDYEAAVEIVAGSLHDTEAAQAFKESGVRKYYRLKVTFPPHQPDPQEIQVRAGSYENAVAQVTRNPWTHLNRDGYYRMAQPTADLIEQVGEPTPVRY